MLKPMVSKTVLRPSTSWDYGLQYELVNLPDTLTKNLQAMDDFLKLYYSRLMKDLRTRSNTASRLYNLTHLGMIYRVDALRVTGIRSTDYTNYIYNFDHFEPNALNPTIYVYCY